MNVLQLADLLQVLLGTTRDGGLATLPLLLQPGSGVAIEDLLHVLQAFVDHDRRGVLLLKGHALIALLHHLAVIAALLD